MTFVLRDRPDGQVEIIVERPVLVGIFPERETAEKVRAFLQAEDDDPPEEPPLFSTSAITVVGEAETDEKDLVETLAGANLDENVVSVPVTPRKPRKAKAVANLPAVVEQPQSAALIVHTPPETLTEAQLAAAFRRIEEGERLSVVSLDLGIAWPRLRGLWAQHCRSLQKHMAEGGAVQCRLCKKDFTPSVSHPETCARCSHE